MCGIAGILGHLAIDKQQLVKSMLAAINHRGPDDSDIYQDEYVCIGHNRLSILDLSDSGRQPMIHHTSASVLAYNGEVYNYLELKHQYFSHLQFRSHTDTEVVLNMLNQYGDESYKQFNGMWAIAWWNPHSRQLTLCRDRFGVKPLYWMYWENCIVFASEIKALLTLPRVKKDVNYTAAADFMYMRMCNHGQSTFFNHIFQIKPAHVNTFSFKTSNESPTLLNSHCYWHFPQQTKPYLYADKNIPSDDFFNLFNDAVKLRLRTDVGHCSLLSGGLDSSAIVASMATQSKQAVSVYSAVYENNPQDESYFAKQVVSYFPQVDAHWISPKAEQFIDLIDQVLWAQEQPIADGSMIAHYLLMQSIADSGQKVVLTGQGGDEILAGYTHTYSPAFQIAAIKQLQLLSAFSNMPKDIKQWYRILYHSLPNAIKNKLYHRQHINQFKAWLDPQLGRYLTARYPQSSDGNKKNSDSLLNQYLKNSITHWSLPGFLHYDDRNSMAFSLESRHPFLDYRLVEYALKQPDKTKIAYGWSKYILRKAFENKLPHEVVWRSDKQGFHAPIEHWLLQIKSLYLDLLHSQHTVFPINKSALENTYKKVYSQLPCSENEISILWRSFVLLLWENIYLS